MVAIGRTVAEVHWVITDGGGIVDGFSDGADAMTASVVPMGVGRFSIRVTVTDDQGSSASADSSIDVEGGGGGGGGALGLPWLIALAISVVAAGRVSRRRG